MIRVRFAPSPTGYLHVGGLRTALYNFVFARQKGGVLILRIEDTDQNRFVDGAVESLLKTLKWAGIEYEEGPGISSNYGPCFQSERLDIYREYIGKLLTEGKAYPCFCTAERLDKLRDYQSKSGMGTAYDRACRNIPIESAQKRMNTEPHVIRMAMPGTGKVTFPDLVRGNMEFDLSLIEDQILIKSDGYPTYHFANVVDDHCMGITHVIRGEEWLPSMPKHLVIYQMFGWNPPEFAHLPLLLNKDRTKLSKRQGDVAVEDYIKKGYLQEAIINFLALLGWHGPDDREIYSMDELIQEFTINRIRPAGAVLDVDKLDWFNQQYIRQHSMKDLINLSKPFLPDDWKVTEEMMELAFEKVTTLADFNRELAIFFTEKVICEGDAVEIRNNSDSQTVYVDFLKRLETLEGWSGDIFKSIMKDVQKSTGKKGRQLWMPVRVALTGSTHGPDLGRTVEILGLDKCRKFTAQAIVTESPL